jgi:hypothetical protein
MTITRPDSARAWSLALPFLCSFALLASCKSDDGPEAERERDGSLGATGDGSTSGGDDGGGDGDGTLDGGSSRRDGGTGRDGGGSTRPAQECPAAVPQNGSSCVSGRGDCTIGDTFCDCPSDTNQWLCWKPSDCPTAAPAEMSACSVVGMECEIATPDGGQNGLDCECTASGWDCGRQLCPASEPTAAAACEGGDGMCSFASGRVCDCRSRAWVCWNQSDCPASAPAAGAACTVQRMLCEYASGDCECTVQGFECEGQPRPRDAGADAAGGDAGASDAGTSDAAASDASSDAASSPDA